MPYNMQILVHVHTIRFSSSFIMLERYERKHMMTLKMTIINNKVNHSNNSYRTTCVVIISIEI